MTAAVAIALYNGEKFIEKQLDSIRLQTVQPDQVILCDDGSKDDTIRIVSEYIQKYELDSQWKLSVNSENLGYARNFYHAMSQCSADVIFLSDQDDIWKLDKIEKMMAVMQAHSQITVLSCKHGVIDSEDQPIHGLLSPKAKESLSLNCIAMENIMRSYRWPGMCLCIRKSLFDTLIPYIRDLTTPHDVVLTVCAADQGGFWEYGYIGADHRRHTNNAGQEEHRIRKVLNLERKLREISFYNEMLTNLLSGKLQLSSDTEKVIRCRLVLSQGRKDALEHRSLKGLYKVYYGEGSKMLRTFSLMCDIWLILFGMYKK